MVWDDAAFRDAYREKLRRASTGSDSELRAQILAFQGETAKAGRSIRDPARELHAIADAQTCGQAAQFCLVVVLPEQGAADHAEPHARMPRRHDRSGLEELALSFGGADPTDDAHHSGFAHLFSLLELLRGKAGMCDHRLSARACGQRLPRGAGVGDDRPRPE